jgi:hypothetical protein
MTNQVIIYPTSEGGIAVVVPSGEISTEEVAYKDVPLGVPYNIIDASEIPSDRSFRNAWTADFSNPDGYGGQL